VTRSRAEAAIVVFVSTALTVFLTYPLAFHLGSLGRVDNGDGQFSIWNVAWVARTIVVDPRHVFDANIFYPHKATLAYSENNLGAGLLAVPVYWATKNPYAAHNSVVLLAFILSTCGTYYLVRYLTRDRGAAAVSAICFAFTPYLFAHTAHIQLLLTAGLPFSLLALHRLVDRPTIGRGAALGLAMAAQALCCGYYGVFVILIVGYGILVLAVSRGLWGSLAYWSAVVSAAVVSIGLVVPAFLPYAQLQRVEGFSRPLSEASRFSSNWSDYFASSSYAHAWMLTHLPPWIEVAFPGFVATILGLVGVWLAWRRGGELIAMYGGLALLACWASFGPAGGLYSVLYHAVPLFAWLRAPARFGLIVALALSVVAGLGVSELLTRSRRPTLVSMVLAVVAAAELVVPSNLREVQGVEPVYRTLATLPPAPVIEMPFFYLREMFPRHTYYMLASTAHWMPLVNGYSDYIPPDFVEHVMTLAPFPSGDGFKLLAPWHVRYAVFHRYWYNESNWHDVVERIKVFEAYLRPLYLDADTRLYEIVGSPP
jgi:hypothetical protein